MWRRLSFPLQHVSLQEQAQGALPGASVRFPIPRLSVVVLAGGWKSSDVKTGSGLVADGSLLGCLFAAVQTPCSCDSGTCWSPSYGPEGESGARLSCLYISWSGIKFMDCGFSWARFESWLCQQWLGNPV